MVRRVLGIVREEAENQGLGEQYKQSMEALQAAEDSALRLHILLECAANIERR